MLFFRSMSQRSSNLSVDGQESDDDDLQFLDSGRLPFLAGDIKNRTTTVITRGRNLAGDVAEGGRCSNGGNPISIVIP